MDSNNKTLRELLDEMKRIEQTIADHKQQVRDVIAKNITEEVYTMLESYDLDAIDKISKRMFADIARYTDDKTDENTETEEQAEVEEADESDVMSDENVIDSYISIPEIRSV